MADEKDSDLIVGPPGSQDRLGGNTDGRHFGSPLRLAVTTDDTEFSGERKRFRCEEGLDSAADTVGRTGACPQKVIEAEVVVGSGHIQQERKKHQARKDMLVKLL
ncbi:MAG TPA: hypothetical protein VFZ57_06435 [Thermoanaerobaculia bacterium]|nr:hypothetical protein [Thermoanaerobaculia bacterium]